jgi:hypothetical protein
MLLWGTFAAHPSSAKPKQTDRRDVGAFEVQP